MDPSSGDFDPLARRLLHLEGGDRGDPATALEATYAKLMRDLSRMVGSGGSAALARRALTLAKREWPLLEGVEVEPAEPTTLTGAKGALSQAAPEAAAAAAVTAIARLLELLVALLGENLGLRSVRTTWPDALSAREGDSGKGES